jgi:hypothetical protein
MEVACDRGMCERPSGRDRARRDRHGRHKNAPVVDPEDERQDGDRHYGRLSEEKERLLPDFDCIADGEGECPKCYGDERGGEDCNHEMVA